MKKILFIAMLLVMSRGAHAQTMYVVNHTDHTILVTIYGYDPPLCMSACNMQLISKTISITNYGTYGGPSTPCDMATAGDIASSCFTICPAVFPSFRWSLVNVFIDGDCGFGGNVSDAGIGCAGAGTRCPNVGGGGCLGGDYITWSASGTDVTIDVY